MSLIPLLLIIPGIAFGDVTIYPVDDVSNSNLICDPKNPNFCSSTGEIKLKTKPISVNYTDDLILEGTSSYSNYAIHLFDQNGNSYGLVKTSSDKSFKFTIPAQKIYDKNGSSPKMYLSMNPNTYYETKTNFNFTIIKEIKPLDTNPSKSENSIENPSDDSSSITKSTNEKSIFSIFYQNPAWETHFEIKDVVLYTSYEQNTLQISGTMDFIQTAYDDFEDSINYHKNGYVTKNLKDFSMIKSSDLQFFSSQTKQFSKKTCDTGTFGIEDNHDNKFSLCFDVTKDFGTEFTWYHVNFLDSKCSKNIPIEEKISLCGTELIPLTIMKTISYDEYIEPFIQNFDESFSIKFDKDSRFSKDGYDIMKMDFIITNNQLGEEISFDKNDFYLYTQDGLKLGQTLLHPTKEQPLTPDRVILNEFLKTNPCYNNNIMSGINPQISKSFSLCYEIPKNSKIGYFALRDFKDISKCDLPNFVCNELEIPISQQNSFSVTPSTNSGGGCLIATATFDSELAPQVQKLREIRDSKLLQTESGSQFMESFNQFYYSFSPIIADYERENPVFKEIVKIGITPLLSTLSLMDYADTESEVMGIGISLIILNAMMYVGLPVFGVMRLRKSNNTL